MQFILFLVLAILCVARSADAATFTVTNSNSSGAGSLAKAITDANATATADTIQFLTLLPGGLVIPAPLPPITQPLTILGYSALGADENTDPFNGDTTSADIVIELNAAGLGAGASMLQINKGPTRIEGLAITNIPTGRTGITIGENAEDVTVAGCFVGVSRDGMSDSSSGTGIAIHGHDAIIGGAVSATRNLIGGNVVGIDVQGPAAVIRNNAIGVDADGEPVLGNGVGIRVSGEAALVVIGGSPANVIAGNTDDGIEILNGVAGNTRMEMNRIHDNGALGIDLANNGVTFNDTGDLDAGPNDLQNYPVLTYARHNGGFLTIEGYLEGLPGLHGVEICLTQEADPSGFGECDQTIVTTTMNAASSPHVFDFIVDYGNNFDHPFYVTATARLVATGATSEYSPVVEVEPGGGFLTVTNTNDSGAGSLRAAVNEANTDADVDTIHFLLPDPHPAIKPLAPYQITNPLIIDGYTQHPATLNSYTRGSNAQLKVMIDGSDMDPGDSVFVVESDGTRIRGLAVFNAPEAGVHFYGSAADGIVEGCFLGTDATGQAEGIGNKDGVKTDALTTGILIGGPETMQRNVISGNDRHGILLTGSDHVVLGNVIGANAGAFAPLANGEHGIFAAGIGASIGEDVREGQGLNLIRYNGGAGIAVAEDAHGVKILGNEIDSNDSLGIDLAVGSGTPVTLNDLHDADVGSNSKQNYPVITSATVEDGVLYVEGHLDVPEDTLEQRYAFRIFASDDCDPSGYGEGAFFAGDGEVDLSGNLEEFFVVAIVDLAPGTAITLTATEPSAGETSEFSACAFVGQEVPLCGDANENDDLTSSDALHALRTSVGAAQCERCLCDVNGSGSVTSSDALFVLRAATDQEVLFNCPPCL